MKVGQLGLRLATGLSLVAALSGSIPTARAALLAYEPFNYPVGQLIGTASLGGDVGFSDATWVANSTGNLSSAAVVSNSFSYTDQGGRTLKTLGNRSWVTGNATATGDNFAVPGTGTGNSQPLRALTAANNRGFSTTENSTTWISYLTRVSNLVTLNYTGPGADGGTVKYGRAAGFQLFETTSERLSFGRASQDGEQLAGTPLGYVNDTLGFYNRGTGPQSVVGNDPLDQLAFVLIRIDHVAGIDPLVTTDDDTAYMWVNPLLNAPPTLGSALRITPASFMGPPVSANQANSDRDYNFNRWRMFAGSLNTTVGYGSVQIDEIRMGETFADVTPLVPEPGSAALAAMGLVALAVRRRK